jgi:hypothetical protein
MPQMGRLSRSLTKTLVRNEKLRAGTSATLVVQIALFKKDLRKRGSLFLAAQNMWLHMRIR